MTIPFPFQFVAIGMPGSEGLIDWRKQRIPIGLGLAGFILVAFNFIMPGLLLLVVAVLFGAYNSDASMENKDTW